jgi:hypothetical protein
VNRRILVVGKVNHERRLGLAVLGLGFLTALGYHGRKLSGSGFHSLLAI